jgi:hypothetical protein
MADEKVMDGWMDVVCEVQVKCSSTRNLMSDGSRR